jgi:hypothetical protein
MEAAVDAFEERLDKMETTHLEANREKSTAVAVHQEVPNEDAGSGDCRGPALAVRRLGRPQKRTQGDGGSQQNLVAARGRLTRRAVPALRKGPSRRGPGKTTSSGIRGQRRRHELRLGSKKTLHEALGKTPELEVVKLAVGISIGVREVSNWTLWRGRPPPKRKKRRQNHSPR